MRVCIPCLFYDGENHIWRFYVNDNRDLMYSIMYDEDKWTKENKIGNEVLDFTVNLDMDNKIYVIYSVSGGDLKYCVCEENKWFGKTVYSFENRGYKITELNVILIGKIMHIFFIGKNNIKKFQCSLMHLSFDKDESLCSTIGTIQFLKDVFCHYQVLPLENSDLSLIFIKHEENEISINLTQYKSNKWGASRRLYGIIGNNINFCTLLHFNKINIVNLSKEGTLYLLEHVLIESDGKMKSSKIYESSNMLTNFLLVEISGTLTAIWVEGKYILTSSYKNQWSEPFKYYTELNNEISIYKYLSLSNKYNNIKCKYILGTNPPEIILLLPKCKNNKEELTTILNFASENKLDIQEEILVLQKTNKNFEKNLIDLQMKYQQKLGILEESDYNFLRLTNAKKKAEEKLNIITEIQQNSLKELDVMKSEKISRDIVINQLNNDLQQLTNEYEGLKKVKISKDGVVTELKSKLQKVTRENEGLTQALKYEKNIGIMNRIFKKNLKDS